MRVIAELREHPGAEDRSQAGLAEDDLSGRVLPKMVLHLPLQRCDLLIEGDQERSQGTDRGGVGGSDHSRLAQMPGPQGSLDRSGLAGDAAAAGALERGADLADGQLRRRGRVGGLGQQLQGVGGVQILERLQGGGEVPAQRVPQPLGVAGALPDQRLVHPGDNLDRFGLRAVSGDWPQLVSVGADHVGQHMRVTRVALGARHRVPLPVLNRLQRVDREHLIPGRGQRGSSPGTWCFAVRRDPFVLG